MKLTRALILPGLAPAACLAQTPAGSATAWVGAVLGVLLLAALVAIWRLRGALRNEAAARRKAEAQASFVDVLLDRLPFPVMVRDAQGRMLKLNAATMTVFDLPQVPLIGLTLPEILKRADRQGSLVAALHAAEASGGGFAGRKLEGVRVNYDTDTGTPRHVLYWQRPFFDGEGRVAGTVDASVDIGDVVRTERQLDDITRNLPVAVFQMRRAPDGRRSYDYLGGNIALLGEGLRGVRDASAHAVRRQIAPENVRAVLRAIGDSTREGCPIDLEFRTRTTARWLRMRAEPRREQDGSILWNGYWIDVTDEHARAAELAEARDVAEAASLAKDRFLAVMSHEIRTPMSGVLGLVEVLAHTPLNRAQQGMVSMVQSSAGALLQILDDILDISKLQAGGLELESVPFDLRKVCEEVFGLLAARAHEKGLSLRHRVSAGVAARLSGDSVRLRQVLFNLLGNAIKFTTEGEVSLSVDAGEGEPQPLTIVVRDTGIGIPEAARARLFAPFTQADSSTTRRFGGTGLGLAISRRLVERMGGMLTLDSTPDAGTVVTVRIALPVATLDEHDPLLDGLHAVVLLRDAPAARAIADTVAPFGIVAHVFDPVRMESAELAAMPAVDMVFVDDAAAVPAALGDVATLQVTPLPEQAAPLPSGDEIRISINPLSTRALRTACRLAVTGMAEDDAVSAQAPPPLTTDAARQAGVLVLAADDNPVNRQLLRSQLELLGVSCEIVEDGAEALARFHAGGHALVLTDCHMPNMNGYALTRAIRDEEAAHGGRRLPVVGVTASIGPEEATRCREAGMDDCLRKPVQLETLRHCLQQWAPMTLRAARSSPQPLAAPVPPVAPDPDPGQSPAAGTWPPLPWDTLTRTVGAPSAIGVLLRTFIDGARADASELHALLGDADSGLLRAWAHRASGASMVLQYPPLTAAFAQFQQVLHGTGDVAERRAAGMRMLAVLDRTAQEVERQLAAVPPEIRS